MRILLIVGFNQYHIRTLVKAGVNSVRPGWDIRLLPSGLREIGFTKTKDVLEAASKSLDVHVLAASQQGQFVKQRLAGDIRPYFRFRWLSAQCLSQLLQNDFSNISAILVPILEEEERWSNEVKPRLPADALLLPKDIFSVAADQDIWGQSEAYGDPYVVSNAAQSIKRFTGRYFVKMPSSGHYASSTQWLSDQCRIFDHRGARHGEPPFPRGWKYSLKIEDGFHYDVSNQSGREFMADGLDQGGQADKRKVAAGKHVNIDAHGYFR